MENNKSQINIAVVGAGYWGPNFIRNFYQLDNVKVAAVCDKNQARLDFVKKLYPAVKTTVDFNEVLNNPAIQAVVIALPTELHYEFAKKTLQAKKHVLLEKPMTSNSEQAKELIKLARDQKMILMVDHTFIYYGPVLKIKEIIESGELGKIYYFDSQRINLGLVRRDVNVIWDLACHDISIMDFLIKENPISVSASGTSHIGSGQEELAHLTIKYEKGLSCHCHVSWLSPVKIRQISIGGTKKMVYFDDIEPSEKIKIYDRGIQADFSKETPSEPIYRLGEVRIPVFDQGEALLKECRHFIECIKNQKTPLTDGESGLRVIKILEACGRSLKEKGREAPLI
ncbi:MAG: Gfo/Idh/MocA family oxidoreductase [bacterium]